MNTDYLDIAYREELSMAESGKSHIAHTPFKHFRRYTMTQANQLANTDLFCYIPFNTIMLYGGNMGKVQRLEQEIKALAPNELDAFRKWFQEYDAQQWDKKIEEDVVSGKLDQLAQKALADHKAGRTKEI